MCAETCPGIYFCRAQVIAAADIDPDNASILVCGGGGVALAVTRKLKDMGSWVWMMQVGLVHPAQRHEAARLKLQQPIHIWDEAVSVGIAGAAFVHMHPYPSHAGDDAQPWLVEVALHFVSLIQHGSFYCTAQGQLS